MVINLPAIPIKRSRFGLRFNTQQFQSPLSGDIQRLELPGARWVAEYTFRQTLPSEIGAMQAFLVQLRGRANSFNAYDPDKTAPTGTGNGTPLVKGADQTGNSLDTDGWANSETVLKAGDYFSVNNELKIVTADVTSNGSGEATIEFEPALRAAPADNAAITVTNPTTTMILDSDDMAMWESGAANYYDEITITAIEVFN